MESDAIVQTFDLAERILDEAAATKQDWQTIERLARELAELARSEIGSSGTSVSPGRPPRA